ncbi:protein tyrosine phosphatase [Sodalis sp. dw_96]|uniref:arsenate reductase/protein-tyrosine-phosphatase family protein n=1 Tax=Sodalis sp. dw_96 TaxID=2719794 RepID=UPI001BD21832|nr:protein tyrosine phosphatase [Sodalis sp. dw_96]
MVEKILVVCMGNICRSPTGEFILKHLLPNKIITSAGISALVNHTADSKAILAAKAHSINIEHHKGRQLTQKLCTGNDLILVMEKKHIEAVYNIAPESRGRVMLFGHWLKQVDIPDPYRKSDEMFELVYGLINDSAHQWAKMLTQK